MPFNSFENKYKVETPPDLSDPAISRRYFLKSISKLAKVAVIKTALNLPSGKLLEKALEKIPSSSNSEEENSSVEIGAEKDDKTKIRKERNEEVALEKINEKKEGEIISTEKEKETTFKETLNNFSAQKIELNLALQKNTEEYYLQQYQSNPQAKRDIKKAFKKVDKWLPVADKIFKQEKVPPELIFLTVPESQGNERARSSRGAVGVFQITKKMGRRYGMKINKQIDERLQVDKSASVCARMLKDNQRLLKSWDLALLAYNGGFVWSYARQMSKNKDYSLDGFLQFMEDRVNQIRKELDQPYWMHKIKTEKSLMSVARRYGLNWVEIEKYNQLKKDSRGNPIICKGQKIKIPLKDKRIKQKIYTRLIAGYLENLNYLPKVKATIQLAQTGFRG